MTAILPPRSAFEGILIRPDDAAYDDARKVHNGLVDKRPALIAQCRGAHDVVAALELARELSLPVSVRGGGHNVAGRAVVDGGLVIDLSLARGVEVDPVARLAVVEGGATWADVNRATQRHGLATTGGAVSSTGVAGLTLGGGLGWLMALHGLAADNLVGAEIVTADGHILHVSERRHSDLFWAIRGGGGNFGVATSFTFRLHPVGEVAAARFRPAGHGRHGPHVVRAARHDARRRLSEGCIELLEVEFPHVSSRPGRRPAGAALPRVPGTAGRAPARALSRRGDAHRPPNETAFPHRQTGHNLLVIAQWLDPAQSGECIAWARRAYDAMRPHMARGRYVDYLGDDETTDGVAAAYGANYTRLRDIKATYDPSNLFRLNQNIPPAA